MAVSLAEEGGETHIANFLTLGYNVLDITLVEGDDVEALSNGADAL